MTCNKKHRHLPDYNDLPVAQDNRSGGRHICAGCAYEEGLKDGVENLTKKTDFSHLPYGQAGTVRHKDVNAAYNLGYSEAKRRSS